MAPRLLMISSDAAIGCIVTSLMGKDTINEEGLPVKPEAG